MRSADQELARLLRRSALGSELVAIERAIRDLIQDDLFAGLDEAERRELDRLAGEAGGRALYGFVAPFAAALDRFTRTHPDARLQRDRPPSPTTPPRAGDWIRPAATDRVTLWHQFTGDLRLRVVRRESETYAETRCGRFVPISSTAAVAPLERSPVRPVDGACRSCRAAGRRVRQGAPRPRGTAAA